MKSIVFFNNKGGVGKTSLVYHIAWMMSELGYKVIAADLDPQTNLTSMFLSTERLEEIFQEETYDTIVESIVPVTEGEGYKQVHIERINDSIGLIIGNLSLSIFEDKLSDAWLKCLDEDIYSFKLMSVFYTIINDAAERFEADFVLIDVGPNLGAINRAVLLSSDNYVIPVGSDLFSLQGIKNLGITLNNWCHGWIDKRISEFPKKDNIIIPRKMPVPAGYIIMQYTARESRPVKSYLKWSDRIPKQYSKSISGLDSDDLKAENDSNCLGLLKHYHSLAPLSQEAKKPMFFLKPADGAIGAHVAAVNRCYDDLKELTGKIIEACK